MTRHGGRAQILAGLLATLAGYVDASGFIAVGGYFVSFMSGNSTRLGIDAVRGGGASAVAATLIAAFLLGVIAGALVGQVADRRRIPLVLATVSILLGGAAAASRTGFVSLAVPLMAAAMGTMNNVFERGGEVSIGLTYMTGSLVKLGQRIASALLGGEPLGWVPYLGLWLGFVLGAVLAALSYPIVGLQALWAVSLAILILALAAWLGDVGYGD